MKIALVGAMTPSKLGLNEYTDALTQAVIGYKDIELHILADILPERIRDQEIKPDKFILHRTWQYNSPSCAWSILKAVKKIKPDVVWFNLLLSTFGESKPAAFLGLLAPLLCRMAGYRVYVTLHHLMDFIEFRETKFKRLRWYDRLGGEIATRLIVASGMVILTLDKYVDHVKQKYPKAQVMKIAHGSLAPAKATPKPARKKFLVFGKFGSYKKVDFIIEVFKELRTRYPEIELVIAGRSHPMYPGYIEEALGTYNDVEGLHFTGYVPQEKLNSLFTQAYALILPYTSTTGVSGPAHLACAFRRPIVASELPDLMQMAKEEGMKILSFKVQDQKSAVESLSRLIEQDALWEELASANYQCALTNQMNVIVDQYLSVFRDREKLLRN